MSDKPLVSIIVPIRNERKHLEGTLNSLLDQTYPAGRYEVLIVDGMSDDGTRELCTEWAAREPRLRLIDNPRKFVASAFNIGIRASKGELVMIVGGHTHVSPDYVEEAVKTMAEHPEVVGTGGPVMPVADTVFGKAVAIAMSHPLGIGNATHRYPAFEGYAFGSAFPTFRKTLFDEVGYYDEELVRNQDDEFLLRVQMRGLKNFITPRIRSDYAVRERASDLFRQFLQYGYWRIPVIRKLRRAASWRQFVPFTFFATLIALLVVTPLWGAALAGVYASCLVISSVALVRKHPVAVCARVPLAVFLMHAGYAFGFARGVLDFVLLSRRSSAMSEMTRS